jgi:hypothetical protein
MQQQTGPVLVTGAAGDTGRTIIGAMIECGAPCGP